jgi:hypothetical protein
MRPRQIVEEVMVAEQKVSPYDDRSPTLMKNTFGCNCAVL